MYWAVLAMIVVGFMAVGASNGSKKEVEATGVAKEQPSEIARTPSVGVPE